MRNLRQLLPKPQDWIFFVVGAVVTLGLLKGFTYMSQPKPLAYRNQGLTISWLPDTVKRWQDDILLQAKVYDIDPDFIAIIMTLESGGFSKAESDADAHGLMQVTNLTAGDISQKFLKEPVTSYDLKNPQTNIEFGTSYLAWLRDEFGTTDQGPDWIRTVELVATGYNGGPGAANDLEQGNGLNDTETVVYGRDAFNMWRERHAERSPTYERWLERGGQSLVDQARAENQ